MPSHLTFLGCKLGSGFIFVCVCVVCFSYLGVMADFTLEVTTGSMSHAGTFDHLYVTLIGTERSSEHTQLTSEVESEKVSLKQNLFLNWFDIFTTQYRFCGMWEICNSGNHWKKNLSDFKSEVYNNSWWSPSQLQIGTYSVTTLLSLGCLLLLKLEKDPFNESPEQSWYCSNIVVRTPEGNEILFPCYTWLSRGAVVFLRGGRGVANHLFNHVCL